MSTQNKTYAKLLETLCDFVNPMNYIINYLNQVWSSCVNQKDVHYLWEIFLQINKVVLKVTSF
jgi:hypothetical protein